ncbi:MAG: FG-GAP repeat protein, partial [Thermoanaerobaculia bacterium]
DHDGHDDLAVGHPGEVVFSYGSEGAVTILMGAAGTGNWNGADFFGTGTAQLPGNVQGAQDLGWSLASGDFDADGHADLAIGIPYRDMSAIGSNEGRENVLYGALFSDGFFYGFPYYWSAVAP